jgi:O-antigen/teichoic acid export membrane protein
MIAKLKELSKDTVVYGVSTITGKLINFLLIPFYTNVFSTDIVGIYANIYAYIAFLNLLFIYGMDVAFLKYSVEVNENNKSNYFSTSFLFILLSTAIFLFFFFLVRKPMIHLMEIPLGYDLLYYYLLAILAFDTLCIVPFANLRIKRNAVKYSIIRIAAIFINIILNFVLILKFKFGIEAILISNLAASAVTFLILIPEIVRNLVIKIDRSYLKKILLFAIPYLPASLAAQLVQVVDRPVVQALTSPATLGIYQANYKLGIFMMLIVSVFQFAWFPFFLNTYSEKDAKETFSKVMTIFLLFTSIVWIVLTLFIDDFARFEILKGKSIIGREFLSGLPIVPVILLSYIFNGIYFILNAGIYIKDKTKYLLVITGSGAVVNVAVNLILIPVCGIMGAAIATLASYVTMSVMNYFIVQRFYRIEYEFGKIFRIIILITISIILYYILLYSGCLTIANKLLLLSAFIASMFILKVVKKENIVFMIKMLGKP